MTLTLAGIDGGAYPTDCWALDPMGMGITNGRKNGIG